IQNHFQWTRPSPGRIGPSGEGKYVQDNGFGHEDWNFNKNLLIDGSIYGYCYYNPTENKRDEKFNIAFAIYTNQSWHLIGFYLDTEFVPDPPIKTDIFYQKMHDLHQLGSSLGNEYSKLNDDKFIKKLKEEAQNLKWRVSPDNAIRTLQPIVIPKKVFNTKNYRIVKPTEIEKDVFDALFSIAQEYVADEDYGFDSELPEGREIEIKHRLRERNPAVIKSAKEAFKQKNGKLYCQVCGFDFQAKYGDIGADFIEGHHTLPISELKGEVKTKVKDVALVCSNCHRMLHRRRPWLKMEELQKLIN
ncbi:MAG: HNH endonuclease, partial [Tissierellales bacterium]|nr:HNH endonuclease [Tissierellales bacterium]